MKFMMKMAFYVIGMGIGVSDLDKVGMQIDINGNGVMDVFNPFIPVTYIQGRINLPDKNSQNYEQSFDFSISPEIKNPYFWLYDPAGHSTVYYYNFTHLGGSNWRITLWGLFIYYTDSNGRVFSSKPNWSEPIMKSNMSIIVGGYRG